jgi:hypothetical protein
MKDDIICDINFNYKSYITLKYLSYYIHHYTTDTMFNH